MTQIAFRIRRTLETARHIGISQADLTPWDSRATAATDAGIDLSASDFVAMLALLLTSTPADFALRCGRQERLNNLGMIGHAIASSRTLDQALGIWMAQAGGYEPLMRCQSIVAGDHWHMGFQPAVRLPANVRRFLVEEWLASFFAFLEEVTDERPPTVLIQLRYAPHPDVVYQQWLPVLPTFRAGSNRLTLPASLLRAPLRSRNDEMLDLILRHFRQQPAQGQSYSRRLRQLLMTNIPERQTLGECAHHLGISSRTLVRRLSAEHSSFSEILDEHRKEHALILASEGRLGAKDIAQAVGFESHQSLRRAFQKWTGQPLGRWKASKAINRKVP